MKKILVVALMAVAGLANADFLYAVDDSSNTLQKIDLTTLTVTSVGALGQAGDFGDLAWGPGNTMYWISGRGNPSLYTVNTSTGAATLVGSHGVDDLFSLGYDPTSGTMYGAQFSGGTGIYTLNTSNGAATQIGNSQSGLGGMTYVPGIGMVASQDGTGSFYQVNSDGTTTLLNNGAGFINDCDIAYDPTRNAIWCADWSGILYMYDLNNNWARTQVMSGLNPMDGLEYMRAVPEPTSMIALAAGVAALLRRRRNK